MTSKIKEKTDIIPSWSSDQKPIYDVSLSYKENFKKGPLFFGPIPQRKLSSLSKRISFLGFPVASKIGVPAGPLLNAKWIRLASDLGFDILTYKTIRSCSYPSHPLPNILYTDAKEQLNPSFLPKHLLTLPSPPQSLDNLAITNSFGMPSQDPEFIKNDLAKALSSLKKRQALVVSITGTPSETRSLKEDFAETARFAVNCGAPIIEANFSCPNVTGKQGSLYLSPEIAGQIAKAIKSAIKDVPLIIKVGHFTDSQLLEKLLLELEKAGVNAVSGINTLSMHVVDQLGQSALGKERPKSGICGAPIFSAALSFVQEARKIIDQNNLSLTLIGVGGAVHPEQLQSLLSNGADFVQSATGMMWDPYLALRFHQQYPEQS